MKQTLFVTPTAKGRPRTSVRNGIAIVYTPAKTKRAEEEIQWLLRNSEYFNRGIPIEVELWMYLPKAKSCKKEYPTQKPDIDNLAKLTLDAINKILYHDDCQVVDLLLHKRFGKPRIELEVKELS